MNASMYDAQQGATSGAQIDVNTSTGTNTWHGQLYGTYANNMMNASPFFFNQAYQLTQQGIGVFPKSMVNPGFVAGARASPRAVLSSRTSSFFFAAYQHRVNEDIMQRDCRR